jgi:hypothetical protein
VLILAICDVVEGGIGDQDHGGRGQTSCTLESAEQVENDHLVKRRVASYHKRLAALEGSRSYLLSTFCSCFLLYFYFQFYSQASWVQRRPCLSRDSRQFLNAVARGFAANYECLFHSHVYVLNVIV